MFRLAQILWTLTLFVHAQEFPVFVPDGIRWDFQRVERTLAIGDIHGDAKALLTLLYQTGLVRYTDSTRTAFRWQGGKTHLVLLGDIVGRGKQSRVCLDIIRELKRQAVNSGGLVHVLVGNHEARAVIQPSEAQEYLHKADARAYAEFLDPAFLSDRIHPFTAGYFGALVSWNSPYARELRSRNSIIRINDWIFTHGGLTPAYLNRRPSFIAGVNATVRRYFRGYQSYYSRRAGLELEFENSSEQQYQRTIDRSFYQTFFSRWHWAVATSASGDSPFWTRTMAKGLLAPSEIGALAEEFSVRGFVLGHSRAQGDKPEVLYRGRVLKMDTGISSALGGQLYAVELLKDQDPIFWGPYSVSSYRHPYATRKQAQYLTPTIISKCQKIIADGAP